MKAHNFLPNHLQDSLMGLASGLQFLNNLLLHVESGLQNLDLFFEVFDYAIIVFPLNWQCL